MRKVWRPFISFHFHEPGEVLLITDGSDIDIFYYETDCESWVTVCDMGTERIDLNKKCFYMEKDILISDFKGDQNG